MQFLMNLARNCRGICGEFEAPCNCDNHTLRNWALSTLFSDSVLTVALVRLFVGGSIALRNVETSFSLLLPYSFGELLLHD